MSSTYILAQEICQSNGELNHFEDRGYSYQLERVRPDYGEIEIFASSSRPLTGNAHSVSVVVPNSKWSLSMSRNETVGAGGPLFGYLASMFVSLAAAMALFFNAQTKRIFKRCENPS